MPVVFEQRLHIPEHAGSWASVMGVTVRSCALISIDGTHLAELSVEGSIPSPRCRHHVGRHRPTGTADRLAVNLFFVAVEETSGV
jgi:hypothetical protein